jgi:hypothetical protein
MTDQQNGNGVRSITGQRNCIDFRVKDSWNFCMGVFRQFWKKTWQQLQTWRLEEEEYPW